MAVQVVVEGFGGCSQTGVEHTDVMPRCDLGATMASCTLDEGQRYPQVVHEGNVCTAEVLGRDPRYFGSVCTHSLSCRIALTVPFY